MPLYQAFKAIEGSLPFAVNCWAPKQFVGNFFGIGESKLGRYQHAQRHPGARDQALQKQRGWRVRIALQRQ
jgi:hypothetical protein